MIDPHELSPGSIVRHEFALEGEPMQAYDIYKYKDAVENGNESYYNTIKPVHINKSWLLRFGFKELNLGLFEKQIHSERFSTFIDKYFTVFYEVRSDLFSIEITYVKGLGKMNMDSEGYTHSLPHIKYVHQLQQALYVFSGEKIKINEDIPRSTLS